MNEENGTLFRDKPVRFPKLPVQNQHSKKLIKLYFLNYIVLSQHTRNNRSNSMSNQLIIKKQGCWLGWLNFLLFHCWKSKLWILVFSLCHVLQLLPWKTSHPTQFVFYCQNHNEASTKSRTSAALVMFEASACLLIPWLNSHVLPTAFVVECEIVSKKLKTWVQPLSNMCLYDPYSLVLNTNQL